jgi:hypothetical protein
MGTPFVQNSQIVSGFIPVDMQTGANTGDWVSVENFNHLSIVLFKGAGTAGDDPTLTVLQATDNAGTSSKALNFTRIYTKQGTLTGIANFTLTTQSAANTYTDATSAEVTAIWVVEFDADDLDVSSGFDHIQASVADVGSNAQLGCCLYLATEPRFAASVANATSAIS